jgi:ribokinase
MQKKPKILVVGSFVMDQIAKTAVFPAEGETVLGMTFSKAPGGKGANQAVQTALLGAETTMIGKLGMDENGSILRQHCESVGIHTHHILHDPETPSGCSVIILQDDSHNPVKNRIIVLPGSNMTIQPAELDFLKDSIQEYDLVMLQLEIPMEINELVAKYAHDKQVPVMMNCAPYADMPDSLLRNLTFISPNEHEAAAMTGITIPHDKEEIDFAAARKVAEAIRSRGIQNVLITLGSAGVVLETDGRFLYSPAVDGLPVTDPTAAGDSFIGAFCTAVCTSMQHEDALVFANHAAAITVSRMGAMPSLPSLLEVETFLQNRSGLTLPVGNLK